MMRELGQRAKQASYALARAETAQKNRALGELADRLEAESEAIVAVNALDVADAQAAGHTPALIDRLMLNRARVAGMAADLRHLAEMPDPVGETYDESVLPNGLRARRQRVPLGVLGVIYEARPNVTADTAGLAIKTGNVALLRGSSETLRSNRAIVGVIQAALRASGLPEDAVQFIDDPDRARVLEMLELHEFIDLIIPRGGAKLHAFCREHSRIPVITGGIGICHLFVDESADLERSLAVIYNAKVQRPTVCNALDTVLAHRAVAERVIPAVIEHLRPAGVSFRLAENALGLAGRAAGADVLPAGPEDFDTEWLSLVLGLKVVDGIEEAMAHIRAHSTGHSDGILTENREHAEQFIREVDSAAVYVNASTRFTDGGQLGLGAEVAVSTQRLHARGPMGLRELTTYKWVVQGEYHVRR
jgi:glutamate-5-semialdehyde dehydrogenase